MGWLAAVAEILKGLLQAIPVLERWFKDTPFENEQEAKKAIDKEHQENNKNPDGRPSGDFWEGDRP